MDRIRGVDDTFVRPFFSLVGRICENNKEVVHL